MSAPPEDRAALVAELFDSAIDCDTAERAALLNLRCADTEIRAEVESLLRAAKRATRFMERVALQTATVVESGRGAFAAGSAIGNYEVVSLLGKGGMGEVYRARDRRVERQVALKLVRGGLDREMLTRRFQREQQLLAGLNHPNIAQLYETGVTADGIPFFAMEYVEGERLDVFVEERGLGLGQRLSLFRKLCGAVAFAHQHLVIHRDIKPANIRVTSAGEPKLLDFGIAKLLDEMAEDETEQTLTMHRMLTPEYASPEQVRGERISTASDVYSLGVVLYELLTGGRPYRLTSRRPEDVSRAITEQEPVRPSAALIGSKIENRNSKMLRGDLDNIVLMALRKQPDRRYPSAAAFSDDIRRYLERLPVRARKDTLGYRTSRFVRRHRLVIAAAAVVLLAIVTSLAVALSSAKKAQAQRDAAQREKAKAERINEFLQMMLAFSNRSVTSVSPVAHGKQATISDMLNRITPRIEAELGDQPEIRGEILRTIGSAYASQGHYDDAEKNLRAALETQLKLHGEASAETADTMRELGVLLFRQLKFDEAQQLLEKAGNYYRSRQGTGEFNVLKFALSLQFLGDVKAFQGDVKGCLRLLKEATEILSDPNLPSAERAVAACTKGDYAMALIVFGETDKGEPLLREAIADFRQASDEQPWELGSLLLSLGDAELKKNRLEDAQKHLSEGEQILRQTLGNQNVYLINALDRSAASFYAANDLKHAEEKAREAIAMAQEISPNPLLGVSSLLTLGDILAKGGRMREAEECYRQCLGVYEQQPRKNYLFIVPIKIRVSQCLLARGRGDEAEPIAISARDDARQQLGGQSPLVKTATNNLIAIYEKLGQRELVERLK